MNQESGSFPSCGVFSIVKKDKKQIEIKSSLKATSQKIFLNELLHENIRSEIKDQATGLLKKLRDKDIGVFEKVIIMNKIDEFSKNIKIEREKTKREKNIFS